MTDTTGAANATITPDPAAPAAPAPDGQRTPSPADLAGRPAPSAPAAPVNTSEVDTTGWPEPARIAFEAQRERANALQAEAAKSRINAKEKAAEDARAAQLQQIAKVLGLATGEDEAPSLDSVTAQLTERTTEAEQARKDAALARTALALRVDPSRLDYLAYLVGRDDTIRGASATDPGFADTLTNTVRGILSTDPTLTAAALPSKSGADTYGGASGSEVTLDAFANMSAAERSKLYQADPAAYQSLADKAWNKSRGR